MYANGDAARRGSCMDCFSSAWTCSRLTLLIRPLGTIKTLLAYIRDHLLKERPELFMDGETMCVNTFLTNDVGHPHTRLTAFAFTDLHPARPYLVFRLLVMLVGITNSMADVNACSRPGILILVNDTDWELLDGLDYQLQDKDNVVFISTLHGG
ncbi:uncharacterized protein MONBRDRAFT_8920 [Monosiga brevicollis MX1]|uniref:Ubiquitin-related modifier 1 homolog n=1 Tax=Monosiga brevicollis TaxID=81824 RepID=A9V1I7_MONBE|nr:uncharacterized protein MONBRDRAFT_8920 [Monosiga brevicollis MX1]EDQ88448.1 predicted protein [Monosiga brevicollis MX1]|eukprot:XP_001746552.1 hypothetical protein [Monosiga brevicollis MX1]